jgi:hypothetical protein
MQITDMIILMLVIVDLVSLSMVTFIFRWARRAMGNFRMQIMELLSGETDESNQIIEKLGHTIYSKLYRYFNLQKPDLSSMPSDESMQNIAESFQSPAGSRGNIDLSKAAAALGIEDPGFLKFLPVIMKFMKNQGNQGSNSSNISNDSW